MRSRRFDLTGGPILAHDGPMGRTKKFKCPEDLDEMLREQARREDSSEARIIRRALRIDLDRRRPRQEVKV